MPRQAKILTPEELAEFNAGGVSTYRQQKYLRTMTARGFTRHTVFIHDDDRDELMALINERKNQRLQQLRRDEQTWL